MKGIYKSPLQQMAATTATDYWNDSCSVKELAYAIDHGAVGATTNPVIVRDALRDEIVDWRERIYAVIADNPTWSEIQVTEKIFEEVALRGASLLLPVFEREEGRKGRLSIQTNPTLYRDWRAMTEQAVYFHTLAPNMQVKLPATSAGIRAIEEATYHGVSVNATVCFTVAQAIAVAEAIERGLIRRTHENKTTDTLVPVCTIMVGRTDDWIQTVAARDGVIAHPGALQWAGVAVFKKGYSLYRERQYRTRLLAAAYRHHLHWSELIGGDVVLTIPYNWQVRFNNSDIEVKERIHSPVAAEILDDLYSHFADFRRAYDEDGLSVDEFGSYGATVRTLRGFVSGYYDLLANIREYMLPNPDIKRP